VFFIRPTLFARFPALPAFRDMPSPVNGSTPPFSSPHSHCSGCDSDAADGSETPDARPRKHPLSTGTTNVHAAPDFNMFLHDVVGITQDVVMVDATESVMNESERWRLTTTFVSKMVARSPLWGILDACEWISAENVVGDILAPCRDCALTGADTCLSLKGGAPSDGTKHMKGTGKGKELPCRRVDHLQAAPYLAKKAQRGSRGQTVAATKAILRVLQPKARWEHHL